MKALVTGAGGFIGSHLCRRLREDGIAVRGLFLPEEPVHTLGDVGVEVFRGDLLKPKTLEGLADGVDTAYHLAARVTDWGRYKAFWNIIVNGTENLLSLSWGRCQRFVFLSSIAAYGVGRTMKGFTEDTPCKRTGIPYGDSKMEAEKRVMKYHNDGVLSCTLVRPANVIGPGSVWVRDALDAFHRGPVPLIDGGEFSASLIYVENLVDGIVLASTKKEGVGQCFNFRDSWQVSWKRYFTDLGALVGKQPKLKLPFSVAWQLARLQEVACQPFGIRPLMTRMTLGITGRNNDVSTEKAARVLGWKTRIPYEEAMHKIEAWVRDSYLPSRKRS